MSELRAAGALADRPDARRARLQPLVDADEAARVQFDAGLVEADIGGVRDAADRHEQIAALDRPLSRVRLAVTVTDVAGKALDAGRPGVQHDLDALALEDRLRSPRATSASSRPMSCRPGSTIVTRLPKRRKA